MTAEYAEAPVRLLVLGQETAGNDTRLGGHPYSVYAERLGHYIAFDFAHHIGPAGSPFWQGYRHACTRFDLSTRGAAWSNLALVQRSDESGTAFSSLPEDQQSALADWQAALFGAMLRFLRPHKVLAFTGPHYDWLLRRMVPDLTLTAVEGRTDRQLATGRSETFGFDLARTYHPGYLNRGGDERWGWIDQACDALLQG